MNVTVIPHGPLGYLTVWPAGTSVQPLVSTLNSPDGEVKANAALVAGGVLYGENGYGEINVYANGTTDVVLDVSGYFTLNSAASVYVPIAPCRVVDTRMSNGTFGAPALIAGQQRSFLLADSSCDLPADMTAVSLNVTAVPIDEEPVYYVTVWGTSPTAPQTPPSSTLNAYTGAVRANAAIVTINPDTYGSVSAYASNNTNLVLDVTGYFVPKASAPAGLSLNPLTPCRVLDTRLSTGEFEGKLTVPITTGNHCNVPDAGAYVTNATVVPSPSGLGFLTLWPDGTPQPLVSTLNASPQEEVASNMAIVSTTDGSIDAFASSPTQLILDVTDYFAETPGFAKGAQPTVVFVGDQRLSGLVRYANNPYWIFNPITLNPDPATDQILDAFYNVLNMNPKPNVVVIQAGNEDAIDIVTIDGGGTCPSPTEILGGICGDESTMAGEAMAEGIKVIVINLLPFGPNVAGFAASTVSDVDSQIEWINGYLAAQLSTVLSPPPPLLDFNTALGNGSGGYNPLYSNDGVLPNAAGYAVMTTRIQQAIDSGLTIPYRK